MTVRSGSEAAWLEQLVGQWDVAFDMESHPSWHEDVRSLGGGWILADMRGPVPGSDQNACMVMMLSYDPAKQRYVGSTAVSMMPNLWVYAGTLDESGNVLTLECEGPDLRDEGRTALYRDTITIIDGDTRKFSSITQNADGSWKPVMSSVYKRLSS